MKKDNYVLANYPVTIEVPRSANEVFDSITNCVSEFWPEDLDGKTNELNAEFIFTTGDSHYSKNKVSEFIPGKKVVWLTTESIRKTDGFDWTGTRMIFELNPKGESTEIKYTYDGPVFENEYERLTGICDMVIKNMLYDFLTSVTAKIEVVRTPEAVFKQLQDVRKWWGYEDLEGSSSKLNDEFTVHHKGAHYSKQKLVEVILNKKIVWLVTESDMSWLVRDKEEWTNTKMIFEISSAGDKTVVHFTHKGLVPRKECYERCKEGWNMIITERLLSALR